MIKLVDHATESLLQGEDRILFPPADETGNTSGKG